MTNNMEVKKDGLRQTQDGLWKLTLTVHPNDMSVDIMQAPMGTRYGLAMVEIGDDEQPIVKPDAVIPPSEKTDGEKMRKRACILCKDSLFWEFILPHMGLTYYPSLNYEGSAKNGIKKTCGIKSRRELVTNREAQMKFIELMDQFDRWKFTKKWSHQLERM